MTSKRGNPSITIRLPEALIERVNAEAQRRLVHRGVIVNAALTEWLEIHEVETMLMVTPDDRKDTHND